LTPEERIDRLQELLVRGTAHAEIDEWPEAIEHFDEALSLADGDPVVAFGLAVAHFKSGAPDVAREWLDRIDDTAPATLRGRAAYVRAKLALEEGDVEGEAAAYRLAAEIDSSEAAYPYSLSQVAPRVSGAEAQSEVGRLLQRAAELWPENGRIGAELAQWFLGQSDVSLKQQGVDLVVGLSEGQPDVEALVSRGLEEFEADPNRTPVSLRRALNLLRPGKRFQADSAALESRLAVLPFSQPAAAALGRRSIPAAATVSFEPQFLLPEAPFVGEEIVLDVVASNEAVDGGGAGVREADLTILTDQSVWFLGRDQATFDRVTRLDSPARQVLVGELDGDGSMEILVLTETGLSLWGRQAGRWSERDLDPALAAASRFAHARLLDFEHDGDLDLMVVDVDGRLMMATHRGEAGLGSPEPSPLPELRGVKTLTSIDLDNDVDQDLLLVGDSSLQVLTNWRQGEYRAGQELPFAIQATDGLDALKGVDYDGDGYIDLVGLAGGELLFWRNDGPAGLVSDLATQSSAAEAIGDGKVGALATSDLDLDGDLDLLLTVAESGGEATLRSLTSTSDAGFEVGTQMVWGGSAGGGLAALDLDGDHDPDPLSWGPAGFTTARSEGAEEQGWLGLTLRGLMGKVPLDGRGARVDVNFGLDSRSFEVERPELIVGLGGRKQIHLIEQELRIEGSCPFLYASDGNEKRFVTDILGLAPLGMLAAPGTYVRPDPEEYLRLPDWVSADGSVELSITEELREVAFLDQVELVVVDTPAGVEAYNGERWFQGEVVGLDLRLLASLQPPAAVSDSRGRDVLTTVARLDQDYLTNHDGHRLYQGAVEPHRLEIEIPSEVAASGRAALVMTGWLHWGNTSTNVARAQDPSGSPLFPFLEVPSTSGGWRRVDLDVGLPAGKTKPVVVDLSGVLDPDDPRVRITTDFEVYWDQIAVAETLPGAETIHRVNRVGPEVAELSYSGFSRWYRTAENGPYLFDYADRRPYPWRENSSGARPIAWQEHEGFYTAFGSTTDLLSEIDDQFVVFGAGEELELSFDVGSLPAVPEGWRRTLFLHSEGWEKDGDPNIACGETVGPLPSRGMDGYPCSGMQAVRGYEETDEVQLIQRRDRWVDRHRLERRVAAWASPGGSGDAE
jgi:tetratricopeptide (TPR) repeat protein